MIRPRQLVVLALLLAAAALLVAGCGSDDASTSADSATTTDQAAGDQAAGDAEEKPAKAEKAPKPEPKGTTVALSDSSFGEVLFDGDDQAIYLFDKETTDTSECYGDCAVEWPPVLTKGEPKASGGIAQGKLGTTERDDGTTQVTYNGHPLYYYANEGPGIVGCHNVPGFGGLWLVLDAAGNAV